MSGPRRSAVEDEILTLLVAALPGVPCQPLPVRDLERQATGLREAGVFVMYAGCASGEPTSLTALVQPQTWAWSVLILARDYRSPQARGRTALELVEAVTDALPGAETSAGRITHHRDLAVDLPEALSGFAAYEVVISIETQLRRI